MVPTQFDQPLEASFAALLAAFARVVGGPLPEVVHRGMHRWRYALAQSDVLPCYLPSDFNRQRGGPPMKT